MGLDCVPPASLLPGGDIKLRRRHAVGTIKADDLAIDHRIGADVKNHRGEFCGVTGAVGK
jgi:hypothetical protein